MAIAAELTNVVRSQWWVLVVRGVLGIAFGILFIFYPHISLVALIYLFGAYALVDGIFAAVQALRLGVHSDRWWPLLFEAVIGIAVGIVFFRFTGLSAVAVAFTIAVWAIATGIFEIVAAFRFGGSGGNGGAPWLLGLGGLLSIIVGVLFAVAPIAALLAYVIVLGIYAMIFGVVLIVWGFRLRSSAPAAAAAA
jgi:uncharacterized membrane protein HdeD (DUF308 family)